MEIILGKTAGFCYGVKRAIDGANEQIEKGDVYCLGEIVHNKQVIEELQGKGIKFIDNISESKGKTLIRAHGVGREVYEEAEELNIQLEDYTCPKVLKIHKIAEEYADKGYFIFLCGSKKHPENIGTKSYCGSNSYIIENEDKVIEGLEILEKTNIKKVLLISQTTFSIEKFYIIEEIIKNELPKDVELIINNTICSATELRQKETNEISKKVEYMIIIGGANSSNTRKLYEIAKNNCKNSVCIETKDELDLKEVFKYEKIGIMAGASTPRKSIDEVINEIECIIKV